MRTQKALIFTSVLAALLYAPAAFSAQKSYVSISSGPILPAGLAKKPSGTFGNMFGKKYILNDMHIEGISTFPPSKIFTIYKDYLKQPVDMSDIKMITERIRDLYIQNDLPAPKIVLPLSRFTDKLTVIEVIEPRALRRSNADPATLGEIMKKTKKKKLERAKAISATAPTSDLSETEVSMPGIATSLTMVDKIKPAPKPVKAYEPAPIVIESFNVTGVQKFNVLAFKSMGQPLVDKLLNIQEVLALAVDIKNQYIIQGMTPPSISMPLDALLNSDLVFHVTEDNINAAPIEKIKPMPVLALASTATVQPVAKIKVPVVVRKSEPKKAPKETVVPQKKEIERIEIKRGIFLIQQS